MPSKRHHVPFGLHESPELQRLYKKRLFHNDKDIEISFQIQNPYNAKIIFLSLDANWDKDIDQKDCFFKEIKKYLRNGVDYWKKNYIHTPMLMPCYTGDGKKYHQNFHKLGFTSNNAGDICLMELLKCCTVGNSSENEPLFMELVHKPENKDQLDTIKDLSKKKGILICIPESERVGNIINELELFDINDKNIIKKLPHFTRPYSMTMEEFDRKLTKAGEELHQFLKSSFNGSSN